MAVPHVRRHARSWSVAFTRGIAVFVGAVLVLGAVGRLGHSRSPLDAWLFSFGRIPSPYVVAIEVCCAGALLLWALGPGHRRTTALGAAAVGAVFAAIAAYDVAVFYRASDGGLVEPAVLVPLSALVAVAMTLVAVAAASERRSTATRHRLEPLVVLAVAATLAAGFPVAQALFFGTSSYARPADAAIVFGAQVHANGALSTSLEDRVATAARLYRQGLVGRLIMSGGIDPNGTDEALAMKRRAEQLGVPPEAIETDSRGLNTRATVSDTVPMLEAAGATRVLVVSQFYHLPRVKLAYAAQGIDVLTVPATQSRLIVQTPYLVAREIPAFWVYWGRSLAHDLFG